MNAQGSSDQIRGQTPRPGPDQVPPPRLVEADTALSERWDRFVTDHPDGTFFHLFGWKPVIETAIGHACPYLALLEGERICGVLPLVHQRSILFGRALISIPFGVYGGALADGPENRRRLETAAQERAARLGVDYLELRYREGPIPPGWLGRDLHATFRKPIDADPEVNLKAIPRKQRAEVRRGIKAGLTGVIDADIERCYDLYAESVRNLGTPVFSRKLFRGLRETFGDACQPLVILHQGRPVAGVVSFYFRDEVSPFYGAGLPAGRRLGAHPFMYWELMRLAAARGARMFDFGRSKRGSGSYDFKKNFGFTPQPLSYGCWLGRAAELPEINPLNPKYRLFIALWKHLPLSASKVMGPWLSRYLG